MDLEPLINWFLKSKRSFSFRENKTPYRVWVSEVMLQQTRAVVVEEYFNRWMQKFPTLKSLSEAELSTVIKVWEGLGYYSRARNLHAGSIQIMKEYQGEFPSTKEVLLKIKGIGPYTAGAILSFAYHKKEPAVDGNVMRVIARLFQIEDEITKPQTLKFITSKVESLLPKKNAHVVMEALIELGATNCAKSFNCFTCPLRQSCTAFANDTQELYPKKAKKAPPIVLHRQVLLLESAGHFLLKKESNAKKIMSDLYEFPYKELEKPASKTTLPEEFAKHFNKKIQFVKELAVEKHTFTKYKAYLYPQRYIVETKPIVKDHIWVHKEKLQNYPFSSGHRRILKEIY
ncbi:MAG: Adenine DNA glycosylase [Chlamydiia bacterium]|nr:Adenine DNA glycosylase [Chlamydiia bacterium]